MGKDRYLGFLINSRTSVLSSQTRIRSFPVRQNPGEGKRGRGGVLRYISDRGVRIMGNLSIPPNKFNGSKRNGKKSYLSKHLNLPYHVICVTETRSYL